MKIADMLMQATVTLTAGDYLSSITRSESYVPNYGGTKAFPQGRNLFKIVSTGANSLNIVPVKVNANGLTQADDTANPIIIQTPNKVTFLLGRTDHESPGKYVEITGIPNGKEHRYILLSFLDFVYNEFALGVNDFTVEKSEHIDV